MKSSAPLLLIVVLLATIGVAGYGVQRPHENERAPDHPIALTEGYRISFERTACFGTCPDFALLIDSDGNTKLRMRALHESFPEVDEPKTLLYVLKLSSNDHAELIRQIESGGFRRLKPDYSILVTDSPSTTITVDTPRGHWSAHVYAVPCKTAGAGMSESDRRDWGITEFVPDIFCELSERLDAIACDTFLHGTRLDPHHSRKPFRPPHCRNTT